MARPSIPAPHNSDDRNLISISSHNRLVSSLLNVFYIILTALKLEYFIFGIVGAEVGEEVLLNLEPLGRRLRADHLQDHLPAVRAHLQQRPLQLLSFRSEKQIISLLQKSNQISTIRYYLLNLL